MKEPDTPIVLLTWHFFEATQDGQNKPQTAADESQHHNLRRAYTRTGM